MSPRCYFIGGGNPPLPYSVPLTATQAMVAALGGDSRVLALYDARTNVAVTSGFVQTWDDMRGLSGYGPQLTAQVTTANKAAYDNTNKLVEVNQSGAANWINSAVSSVFDPSLERTFIYIGTLESGQPYTMSIQDAALGKYTTINPFSSPILNSQDTGGNLSLLSAPSTTRRLAHISFPGTIAGPRYGSVWGRHPIYSFLAAGVVASNWLLSLGGTNAVFSNYAHAFIRAVMVVDHQLSTAEWAAVQSYAVSEHGAVRDDALTKGIYWDGNSLTAGVGATTPSTDSVPSLIAAGLTGYETTNAGIQGQTGAVIALTVGKRIQLIYSAGRTKNLYVLWGEGTNDLQSGPGTPTTSTYPAPSDQTTYLQHTITACQVAKAAGCAVCVGTIMPAFGFTAGQETVRQNINAYILAHAVADGWADAVADPASIVAMQSPPNGGNTYWTAGGLHPTTAGYALCYNDASFGFNTALAALV